MPKLKTNKSAAKRFRFTKKGKIEIVTEKIPGAIKVSVKDTGVGIKKEDCERLFQSFSQVPDQTRGRKTGGTGLGLAISKKIVEQHGGRLWLESVYGKGSTFYIELPVESIFNNPDAAVNHPEHAGHWMAEEKNNGKKDISGG